MAYVVRETSFNPRPVTAEDHQSVLDWLGSWVTQFTLGRHTLFLGLEDVMPGDLSFFVVKWGTYIFGEFGCNRQMPTTATPMYVCVIGEGQEELIPAPTVESIYRIRVLLQR